MTRLAVDDPITIVTRTLTLCLVVETVSRNTFTCSVDDFLPDVGGWQFDNDEEGILWLRGWYTPDSEEVKAARVAQGIGDQKRPKKPTYKELEAGKHIAEQQALEARKQLEALKQEHAREVDQHRSNRWTQINPHYNESYSDAAARKKWGY